MLESCGYVPLHNAAYSCDACGARQQGTRMDQGHDDSDREENTDKAVDECDDGRTRGIMSEGEGEHREGGDEEDEEDEADDENDSDTETQRIGNSVLRFARRCVKIGEFAKAMAALMSIIEISDLASMPCRQALLFTVQILHITDQTDKALACMMEIWTTMPSPYTTSDAQLILAMLHEHLQQPRFVAFWYKQACGSLPTDIDAAQSAWLALAWKSYAASDLILAREAFLRTFACIFQSRRWSADACPMFRFVAQFLVSLASVSDLRLNRQMENQSIALSLTIALEESGVMDELRLCERARDPDYLQLRRVYSESFPVLYSYLFTAEDDFVGRISRAWRVFQARQRRNKAKQDRERERAATVATGTDAKRRAATKKEQKKATAKPPLTRDDARNDEQLRAFRRKTQARVQSFRSPSPSAQSPGKSPILATRIVSPVPRRRVPRSIAETVASPTRRKLETVKQLRGEGSSPRELPPSNQLLHHKIASPVSPHTLLDVYAFPALENQRRAFEAEAGRTQGAADVDHDLEDIETFARMAHYRSRVLVDKHHRLVGESSTLDAEGVLPDWLRQFNAVLRFVGDHYTRPHKQLSIPATTPYFSQLHARVVRQLTQIYRTYVLQHGKTTFTIELLKWIKRIDAWQFTSVHDDLLRGLGEVQAMGTQEEAHRNLEFYHLVDMQKMKYSY